VSVLVDTNVLQRRTRPGHAQYNVAVESVARLHNLAARHWPMEPVRSVVAQAVGDRVEREPAQYMDWRY